MNLLFQRFNCEAVFVLFIGMKNVRLTNVCVARHIAAYAHLSEVIVKGCNVGVLEVVDMRCLFKRILCVVPSAERKGSSTGRGKLESLFSVVRGKLNISYVNSVAVLLRTHIVVLKVIDGLFPNADFTAGLSVGISLLRTSAVLLNVVQFLNKSELSTEAEKCAALRCTL